MGLDRFEKLEHNFLKLPQGLVLCSVTRGFGRLTGGGR
jgi:hypothetical protein